VQAPVGPVLPNTRVTRFGRSLTLPTDSGLVSGGLEGTVHTLAMPRPRNRGVTLTGASDPTEPLHAPDPADDPWAPGGGQSPSRL